MLAVGVLLLAAVSYDVLSTTLSFGSAAGPITSRVGRAWWEVARRVARGPESPIMSSTGPVVIVLTIGVWLAMLWGGWTLVFSADPDAVLSSSTRTPAAGWSRLYYAGFTVFTLGVGDYIPNGRPWEVLTAVAVMSGLGLTTMAITYLVPVVSAVTARRVQANTIAGLGPTPQDIVIGAHRGHGFDYLDHRLPSLADSLLETAERHLAYPVLHFFHSGNRHVDLRVQAVALDETISILQHGVDPASAPHPQTLESVRHAVSQLILRATGEPADGPPPPPPDLSRLREAGISTVSDETFAERLAELEGHRRRLASFANESLWAVPTEAETE